MTKIIRTKYLITIAKGLPTDPCLEFDTLQEAKMFISKHLMEYVGYVRIAKREWRYNTEGHNVIWADFYVDFD